MHQPRGAAHALAGIAAIEDGRLQCLAGLQPIGEIERIETAHHAHIAHRIAVDADPPGTAPGQGAEPDVSVFLARQACAVDREPGIGLHAGGAAAAFDHGCAFGHGAVLERPFGGPAPGQIMEVIITSRRKRPGRGGGLIDPDRRRRVVADDGGTADDPGRRIDRIAQGDMQRPADIRQLDGNAVALRMAGYESQDGIAHAIGIGELQRGLGVEGASPAWIFLGCDRTGRIHAGRIWRRHHFKLVGRGQKRAPIDRLQRPRRIDAKGVGDRAAIQPEQARGRVEMRFRMGQGRKGQRGEDAKRWTENPEEVVHRPTQIGSYLSAGYSSPITVTGLGVQPHMNLRDRTAPIWPPSAPGSGLWFRTP